MRTLLLRLLPFLVAAFGAAAALSQWSAPQTYPWPLLAWMAGYLFACALLVWRRLSIGDALEKILPSVAALASMGLGFLVVETTLERWALTIALSGTSLLVLELLFLLTRDGARYPVNGLSRVNLTLTPVAAFFLAATLNALYVFLRWPWWSLVAGCALFGFLFYALTAHPTADRRHRRRWSLLGGTVGAHVGLLAALLPVAMPVHGALAALFVALPLRIRRYAYQPLPGRMHAWVEGSLTAAAFLALLATSRWA